jgi:hypothetical protein
MGNCPFGGIGSFITLPCESCFLETICRLNFFRSYLFPFLSLLQYTSTLRCPLCSRLLSSTLPTFTALPFLSTGICVFLPLSRHTSEQSPLSFSFNGDCSPAVYNATPSKCFGGVARRKTFVDNVRAAEGTENVLLVDAGAYFDGTTHTHTPPPSLQRKMPSHCSDMLLSLLSLFLLSPSFSSLSSLFFSLQAR